MGFWKNTAISWVGWALLALACPCSAAPVPAPEEPRVPWLVQPLQPPARLDIDQARVRLDFTRRERPHWVWLTFTARLTNPAAESRAESLLLTAPDGDAQVLWKGQPVSQERVVMPVPQENVSHVVSGRVSVVRLILLPHEVGTLEYRGFQPLQFSDSARSTVSVLMPLERAWAGVHDSTLEARLAPELHMLSSDWHSEAGSDLWERKVKSYAEAPTRLTLLAETRRSTAWLGALGAIPALWRCWIWGVGLAWVCVTLAAALRRGWWLTAPATYLLYGMALRTDPVCAQWTWYAGAPQFHQAIERFGWALTGLVALASFLVRRRAKKGFSQDAGNAGQARIEELQ